MNHPRHLAEQKFQAARAHYLNVYFELKDIEKQKAKLLAREATVAEQLNVAIAEDEAARVSLTNTPTRRELDATPLMQEKFDARAI